MSTARLATKREGSERGAPRRRRSEPSRKYRLEPPDASASPEEHADWLELRCLIDPDRSTSISDLIREFRRSGTADDLRDDARSETSEQVAESAFLELSDRSQSAVEGYPFAIRNGSIVLREGYLRSPYIFQLLLWKVGLESIPREVMSPAKLFEELAAVAAGSYFSAKSYAFGFPRNHEAKNFTAALSDLCARLGEGGGAKPPPAGKAGLARQRRLAAQKDGKLDIVVWRSFPDTRGSQFIGFGQCATGRTDWSEKVSELQPDVFRQLWLRDNILLKPVRMFFVPHRISRDDWEETALFAGLLFDRCRTSHHATKAASALLDATELWNRAISARLTP